MRENNSIKVCIIIPTRYAESFIEECLDSIAKQNTFIRSDEIEIFVGIDSCLVTKANLGRIHYKYKSLRIFYFNQQIGPFIIKNTLSRLTDAEQLLFFDSDDIMQGDFIDSVYKLFAKNRLVRYSYKDFMDKDFSKSKLTENSFVSESLQASEFSMKKAKKTHSISYLIKRIFLFLVQGKIFSLTRLRNNRHKLYPPFLFNKIQLSGVFAISKINFELLTGFKPWTVAADADFLERAAQKGILSAIPRPEPFFLRRIHGKNISLDTKIGRDSEFRRQVNLEKGKPISEEKQMQISTDYTEMIS